KELLNKALKSLENSFTVVEEAKRTESNNLILAAQDSTIQRFEYSYDSFWKFLKKYFELKHDLQDLNSPKSVFRACVKLQLCTELEGKILIEMADARNETSHNYNIESVRLIFPNIFKYYQCMTNILKQIL